MKTLILLFTSLLLILVSGCSAQVKNPVTYTVRVDGDCPMCEKTIENAAYMKGEAEADWDVEAKRATITYDSTRTNADEILRRIAQAGYDNERYLAPDAAYIGLPACCQYERTLKHPPLPNTQEEHHIGHQESTREPDTSMAAGPLTSVFETYFQLKDALVMSDDKTAQTSAQAFHSAIQAVDMGKLPHDVHIAWMAVSEPLSTASATIARSQDIDVQRKTFIGMTPPMTQLVRAAPPGGPVYLDHCPMYEGGSDWLSREKAIRNPYYGAQMLTCGSVKETILE